MNLTLKELEDFLVQLGYKKFRAGQIVQWITKGTKNIDEMTNLAKDLKDVLKEKSYIGSFKIHNKLKSKIDNTVKYIFEIDDGNIIESVLMEYKHGLTVCISSQVGCKMGCKFCASTGLGFDRNLTTGEMLDQVITIQKDKGERISNVVIMGIGEPLDNYENVIKFFEIINSDYSLNIGLRHITLSTCGLVPLHMTIF